MTIRHLDLFAGIGGFSLAAEWAGIQTVGFVERDSFCRKVLAKHWPNVPMFGDIHDVTGELVRSHCGDIDLITGGFPCQPFSLAGKRLGNEDDRAIWPQMLRVITECRPCWVVGENVTGIIDMALDGVLASLEAEGYEAWPVVFPACAVGAWHIRQRVFVIAHADGSGSRTSGPRESEAGTAEALSGVRVDVANTQRITGCDVHGIASERRWPNKAQQTGLGRANVEYPNGSGRQEFNPSRIASDAEFDTGPAIATGGYWAVEPAVGRVADGVPNRTHRLKALGNAVVPQQVYPILKLIAEIERGEE